MDRALALMDEECAFNGYFLGPQGSVSQYLGFQLTESAALENDFARPFVTKEEGGGVEAFQMESPGRA